MRDPHDHHHYVSNLDRIDTGNQVGNLDLLRKFPFHIPLLHTTLLQFKPKKKRKKKKKTTLLCVFLGFILWSFWVRRSKCTLICNMFMCIWHPKQSAKSTKKRVEIYLRKDQYHLLLVQTWEAGPQAQLEKPQT